MVLLAAGVLLLAIHFKLGWVAQAGIYLVGWAFIPEQNR
jgi:hypothetical protein